MIKLREEEEVKAEEQKVETVKEDFKTMVKNADDLADYLQDLTDHLKENTGATGVYIGKLVKPIKPITDEDDDTAHLNEEAENHIQYIHASKDHSFLID